MPTALLCILDGWGWRPDPAPDNAIAEKSHQRGPAELPLKQNDWNQIQVALAGDTLKLKLNDIEVYECPVATNIQRHFGLFHFADETDVRVKEVLYRGNWPKTLPTLKDQEFSSIGQ